MFRRILAFADAAGHVVADARHSLHGPGYLLGCTALLLSVGVAGQRDPAPFGAHAHIERADPWIADQGQVDLRFEHEVRKSHGVDSSYPTYLYSTIDKQRTTNNRP